MFELWLRRWGRTPDEIAQKVQSTGLVRTAAMISRVMGKDPPKARAMPEWIEAVFAQLLCRICNYTEVGLPAPMESGALKAACGFLEGMPRSSQEEFQSLLVLLEFAPFVFGPHRRRFTQLGPRDQDIHLQGWERSTLLPKKAGFKAMKSVAMMGYWTRPASFPGIGYSVANNPGVPEPQKSYWQEREAAGQEIREKTGKTGKEGES